MAFDRYHIHIVGRMLLAWGLGIGGLMLILGTDFWLAGLWLVVFSVAVLANLILFTSRYRRGLSQFLEAIKQHDFSLAIPMPGSTTGDIGLKKAYRDILQVFRDLSSERESQHHFLHAILAEVDISLVVLDATGEIVLFNPAFSRLVGKKQMRNLHSLAHLPEALLHTIGHLADNDKTLVRLTQKDKLLVLSARCSQLVILDKEYRILTLQDIRAELDEKELDAWQKLIRILTHEIMNSAIPVATLTAVTRQNLENKLTEGNAAFSAQELDDLLHSMRIIENRSKGLASFVDAYRSMTAIKVPEFHPTPLLPLIHDTVELIRQEANASLVEVAVSVHPTTLQMLADRALLEQVLINLLKNALDAVAAVPQPRIAVAAVQQGSRTLLTITDNGTGMPQEVLDQIFVPFYTTKQKGSGIGLSLSRQIIRLHGGTLTATSEEGKGSRFEVVV